MSEKSNDLPTLSIRVTYGHRLKTVAGRVRHVNNALLRLLDTVSDAPNDCIFDMAMATSILRHGVHLSVVLRADIPLEFCGEVVEVSIGSKDMIIRYVVWGQKDVSAELWFRTVYGEPHILLVPVPDPVKWLLEMKARNRFRSAYPIRYD